MPITTSSPRFFAAPLAQHAEGLAHAARSQKHLEAAALLSGDAASHSSGVWFARL